MKTAQTEKPAGADKTRKEELVMLAVRDIEPSGDNPRIIDEKSPKFLELLGSIRGQGVLVPVIVRNHPQHKGKYELLGGQRRLAAEKMAAGLGNVTLIRAINYGTISDAEAFEITFAENFAREDLSVLEQGRAVNILFDKYDGDTKAVASKLGKSISWVLQRRAIETNLSKNWKKALAEPHLQYLTASHLQFIAAIPQKMQDEMLADVFGEWDDPRTVAEIEQEIKEMWRLLKQAPWDMEDRLLGEIRKGDKKGAACSGCLDRTDAQPGLFDDTDDPAAIADNARCLNPACWYKKMTAYLDMKRKELLAKHKNLIFAVLPDEAAHIDSNEYNELTSIFGPLTSQWKGSEEGKKDAVPAMIVHGPKAGELRWIIPQKQKAGSPVANHKSSNSGTSGKASWKSMAEKRKMLDKKRWSVVIRKVSELVGKADIKSLVCDNKISTVMALTATFGTTFNNYGLHERRVNQDWMSFAKLENEKQPEILETLWLNIRKTLSLNLIDATTPITQTKDELIEDAKATARLIGLDIDKLFAEACEEYKEPKSWANQTAETADSKNKKVNGKKKI
ncbi:MAG: ParB/RepB/Spo0J family partition protein [Sedimentisphaerales bacterium]|jgi:ParB/RepB/Spo0J family partition protein